MAKMTDVAAKAGVKPEVVKDVLAAIKSIADSGEKVSIHKFGTFEVRKTASRAGRNPKTNDPILIPAGSKFAFKASKKAA